MFITERIQAVIHALEVRGARWLNYAALTLIVAAMGVWYDTHCYHNFNAPAAMDAAQVARNLAEGRGFTTECIRPFSIYLLKKHNGGATASQAAGTNMVDAGEVYGRHPDLANAPLYPAVLAGLFKVTHPDWKVELNKPFWGGGGRFQRYKPEFIIAIFNQILLLLVVLLTFLVAKTIFDTAAAWLAGLLMLGSDLLWKTSVSGLPTMLMLVIFLGVIWTLASFESLWREENPANQAPRRQFMLAMLAGFLTGVGMLTRYSFGWAIVPVFLFFILFGRTRRMGLGVSAFLVFAVTVLPWVGRNLAVSGTFFGTAGYAPVEGTFAFSGTRLMQSLMPDMTSAYWLRPYLVKLKDNLDLFLNYDLLRLGGGWMAVLFLAGLLLGLRNIVARRVRYFTMICIGVFLLVSALGQTAFTATAADGASENLLILLTPLVVIFGVAFFLTLLNQMNAPTIEVRYSVIGLIVLLMCQPLVMTLLPPRVNPVAYPPYYPPDIQKFSEWMQPNDLVMSDVPWAVAWYGDRPCVWTTLNCQYEFNSLNDFVKPVNALYLTLDTLNGKFLSECYQGGVDNWRNFAYRTLAYNQLPPNFPLRKFPLDTLRSGLFITDRQRWDAQ